MSDISLLLAEAAIRRLPLLYASHIDNGDMTGLSSIFTANGSITGSGANMRGRAQITQIGPKLKSRYSYTYHTVLNHVFAISGKSAIGEVYSHAHHITLTSTNTARDYIMAISYRDRYLLEGDNWLIDSRELDVKWTQGSHVDIGASASD